MIANFHPSAARRVRRLHRLLIAALVIVGGCSPMRTALLPVSDSDARLAGSVTITRDEWNVPHVHGETDASVAFGIAWAQAEDGYREIEERYIHALGRASYWYGDRFLADDLAKAASEVERLSREEYARERPARQAIWAAYAAGLNYYLETTGTERRVIARWEPWMLFAPHRLGGAVETAGAVAVAPDRAADGYTLLLQKAAFAPPMIPYEMHLHSDEGWHVSGVAALGTPLPTQGHSEHAAWAHVPRARGAGAALLAMPDSQRIEWIDTISVNTADGVVEREYRFRRTPQGPVVTAEDGAPVAIAAPGVSRGGTLQQWYAMGRAAGLDEFEHALAARDVGGTVLYADTAGRIYRYRSEGHPEGDDDDPGAGVLAEGVAGAVGEAADTLPWSMDRLERLAFVPTVGDADAAIAALVLEWEQVGGGNPARAMRLDGSLDLLRAWDRTITPPSEAATLYVLWQERVAVAADGAFPRLRALEDVVAELERERGSARVPWSEIERDRRAARLEQSGLWISVTQLGPDLHTRSLAVTGGSTQAELFLEGRLKRAWFARDDVAANGVRVYRPGEPPVR